MFYDQIVDAGFTGTAPQRAAHEASIRSALQRVDAASNSRSSSNKQPLHQHVSSVSLGGTNAAPIVSLTWLNPVEIPAMPIMLASFSEASLKNLVSGVTVKHDGQTLVHNVDLAALAALAW